MAWVVTIKVDTDKTDIGTISSVFTDTDTTTFSYSERIQASLAQLNAYITRAVAARNAWQTRKSNQTTYMNTAVTRFGAAGETATAGTSN
jgi:hypothetical protein